MKKKIDQGNYEVLYLSTDNYTFRTQLAVKHSRVEAMKSISDPNYRSSAKEIGISKSLSSNVDRLFAEV